MLCDGIAQQNHVDAAEAAKTKQEPERLSEYLHRDFGCAFARCDLPPNEMQSLAFDQERGFFLRFTSALAALFSASAASVSIALSRSCQRCLALQRAHNDGFLPHLRATSRTGRLPP